MRSDTFAQGHSRRPGNYRWKLARAYHVAFEKGLHLSGFRRPLDLKRVALDGIDVEVAVDGESGHPFAYTLTDIAEPLERSGKSETRFFEEFAAGSDLGILAVIDLDLGN
ncbi:MAG: hypothetical protein ABSG88_05290 [Bradyrhizobium sp.]|jgi:hypothetical protein